MSIVTPLPQQTTINLYRNVPWDNTYQDIRLFDSESERLAFFTDRVWGSWSNCSIVSPGSAIKLSCEKNFETYLSCNYMSFWNTNLTGNRVWYAFIKSIEYINVNTFKVEYEIDWVQSYLFNFSFETCFVEREHVNDDTFGKHTIEENLDIGEYNIEYIRNRTKDKAVIMQFLADSDNNIEMINGVGTALKAHGGLTTNLGTFNDFLIMFNDTPEKIVSIYMGTADMISSGSEVQPYIDGFTVLRDSAVFKEGTDTYTPQNNKMLCYPYKFFTIDNYSGEVQDFRWEECEMQLSIPKCDFQEVGTPNPAPCIQCYPLKYKNWQANGIESNAVPQFAVTYNDFPMVPYAIDTFRAWESQTSLSRGMQAMTNVLTGVGSFMIGASAESPGMMYAGAQGMLSTASNIADMIYDKKQHEIHNVQMQGTVGQCGINFNMGRVGFRETQYGIRPEYARIIDKYFTRYGYKVNEIKVPNTKGRSYVNFVKCKNAHVGGNIALDAKLVLERAMNSGCSFWHTNNVGMSLTNNPII